jgi:predicted ATP-grasp superfamily ATP-dependent carboligase
MNSLLIIGNDIVPITASAYRAGYQVYSIDFFGDSDLRHYCAQSRSIIHQRPGQSCGKFTQDYDVNILLSYFKELITTNLVDGVILGSGLEDHPEILEEIAARSHLIGNTPKNISQVRHTTELFETLEKLHIPFPVTHTAHHYEEAKKIGKDIGYPLILKPTSHFGGMGIQYIQDQESLQTFYFSRNTKNEVLIQEVIQGIPASVSTLSTTSRVVAISVNEQLSGLHQLGITEPYGYCGNIVPLDVSLKVIETAKNYAETIASHFRLIGSNGMDFIVTESGECVVIEVNPRIQGTIECLEQVYDTNIVTAHIQACTQNKLARTAWIPRRYCTRLILYARQTITVPSLQQFQDIRDIPFEGTVIEKGEPLCSLHAIGSHRYQALSFGFIRANQIYEYLAQMQATTNSTIRKTAESKYS